MSASTAKCFTLAASGAIVDLRDPPLDAGGEGEIFLIENGQRIAKRIFCLTPLTLKKLRWMIQHLPSRTSAWAPRDLAWPEDLVIESAEPCGYVAVYFSDSATLEELFDREWREDRFPNWTYAHLVNLAANLALAFERAHRLNLVIGDVSPRNVLCDIQTYVKLIDLESCQIDVGCEILPCLVATAECTPPELQGVSDLSTVRRTVHHDSFGLAVLIYQILTEGKHPFHGIVETPQNLRTLPPGIPERVTQNLWPFSSSTNGKPRVKPPPGGCDFEMFPRELRALFLRAFDEGHSDPTRRPASLEFAKVLQLHVQDLTVCRRHPRHRHAPHLSTCPWCARRDATGVDSFPQ